MPPSDALTQSVRSAPQPNRADRLAAQRLPAINTARGTGCGRCVAVCQPHLLSLKVLHWQKFWTLRDMQLCTSCHQCAAVCPFHAITMRRPADGRAAAFEARPV